MPGLVDLAREADGWDQARQALLVARALDLAPRYYRLPYEVASLASAARNDLLGLRKILVTAPFEMRWDKFWGAAAVALKEILAMRRSTGSVHKAPYLLSLFDAVVSYGAYAGPAGTLVYGKTVPERDFRLRIDPGDQYGSLIELGAPSRGGFSTGDELAEWLLRGARG
jgi:hypothetical protein